MAEKAITCNSFAFNGQGGTCEVALRLDADDEATTAHLRGDGICV
jgi:hypothetical protein